jgi:hypothetical protein
MTELTKTLIDNWLVVTPEVQVTTSEFAAELDPRIARVNAYLEQIGVEPAFTREEMRTLESGQPVLRSPNEIVVIQITTPTGQRLTRHCPRLMIDMLASVEHQKTQPAVEMGNKMLVTLPLDLGPLSHQQVTLEASRPPEFTMFMFMEKPELAEQPNILVGRGAEFAQLAEQAPTFQPIRLSNAQFDELNAQLDELAIAYGKHEVNGIVKPAEWARLPHSMQSETSNVAAIRLHQDSGKYLVAMEFTLTDGSKHIRQINNAQRIEDKVVEGDNFCIVVDAVGEKHFVVVDRKRVNGEFPLAFPRGFSVLSEPKYQLRTASRQTGINTPELLKHKINGEGFMVEDPTFQDVRGLFHHIEFPPGTNFDLAAKQAEEPLAAVEDLVPTLLSVRDAIAAIQEGRLFNDAHTIAMIGTYLFGQDIITLSDHLTDGTSISELQIVMALVQDYRTGEARKTLWRDNSEKQQVLEGSVSPNSGVTRIWHDIGLADGDYAASLLAEAKQPWRLQSLQEIIELIKRNASEVDVVTIAAITKLVLQNNLGNIDYQKLITDPTKLRTPLTQS